MKNMTTILSLLLISSTVFAEIYVRLGELQTEFNSDQQQAEIQITTIAQKSVEEIRANNSSAK